MSYCRMNDEDSDVYVFGNSGGFLECCGCHLYKNSFSTTKYSAMINHLEFHKNVGDKVPERAFERLKKEQETGDTFTLSTNVKPPKLHNVRKTKNEMMEQKFYREMGGHRKQLVDTALTVFEKIYGRKPHKLELDGIADSVNIKLDLYMSSIFE